MAITVNNRIRMVQMNIAHFTGMDQANTEKIVVNLVDLSMENWRTPTTLKVLSSPPIIAMKRMGTSNLNAVHTVQNTSLQLTTDIAITMSEMSTKMMILTETRVTNHSSNVVTTGLALSMTVVSMKGMVGAKISGKKNLGEGRSDARAAIEKFGMVDNTEVIS